MNLTIVRPGWLALLASTLLALVVLLPVSTLAAPGAGLTPAQEADHDYLIHRLMAPCCWTSSVAEHGSGQAPVVEAEIREMLLEGRSRQEIEDHYIAKFGERILVEPKARGFNVLAYVTPWLLLLVGLGIIVRFATRGRGEPEATPAETPPSDPYVARVRDELRRLD